MSIAQSLIDAALGSGTGGGTIGATLGALGLGAGGGYLTYDAYDKMKQIGKDANTAAQGIAEEVLPMSQFKPFTITSSTGSQFGASPQVDAEGNIVGTEATMGLSQQEQDYYNMMMEQANAFGQMSGMDTTAREAEVYDRIRATQTPEEDRQRLALEERMFNQGRLGVSTGMFGGTPEAFSMNQAQAEARNRASLAAISQAQAEQLQNQQMGLASLGGAYLPQGQLMNVQQSSQLFPQMQQQAQLYGAGQYGQTMMSGISAQLIAEQKAADLIGGIGGTLLGGLFK